MPDLHRHTNFQPRQHYNVALSVSPTTPIHAVHLDSPSLGEMKRSRQLDDDKGLYDNLQTAEHVALKMRTKAAEGLAGMEGEESERSSRACVCESTLELSPRMINMSVITGPHNMPTASSQLFPYAPLNAEKLEIRVVVLRAGTKSSPIRCDICHISTKIGSRRNRESSLQSYKALSYTWGSPDIHKTIYIGDVEVQVRENLWQALYHLRAPDTDCRLWIDAICINQNDILERNQQVSRMGTIYGMAEEVIVWLGPEEDDSTMAFEFIQKTMHSDNGNLSTNEVDSFVEQLVSATPIKWAISRLVERGYWKRAWIIQEVFRARVIVIHCGTSVLPWTYFAKFFRTLDDRYPLYGAAPPLQISFLKTCIPANLTWHRTCQNHNLETLLETYKHSLCSDPRDRIYSMIGLASGKLTKASVSDKDENEWIEVDYTKSPAELFNALSRLMMSVRELYPDIVDRPEFFTDLRVRRLQLLHEVLTLKLSCLEKKPEEPREASIRIDCCAFDRDTVFSIIPEWRRNREDPAEHQRDIQWYRKEEIGFRFGSAFGINDLEPMMEALEEDDLVRVRKFRHMDLPHAVRWIDIDPQTTSNRVPIQIIASAPSAPQATSTTSDRVRFFTTRGGHLGIASHDINPDDVIYRFRRSDVAIAVRFTPDPMKESATLIGRVLLLKSDRQVAFEAGTPMAEFKYDVPHSKGTDHIISLPLAEWQFLTW